MKNLFLFLLLGLASAAHAASGEPRLTTAELTCLAHNMYYEARGEGVRGMVAVGQVTLNRVRSRGWRATVCGVVYQPYQFSWTATIKPDPQEARAWQLAQILAEMLLQPKRYQFHNSGATHYVTRSLHRAVMTGRITNPNVTWIRSKPVYERIGNHVFMA